MFLISSNSLIYTQDTYYEFFLGNMYKKKVLNSMFSYVNGSQNFNPFYYLVKKICKYLWKGLLCKSLMVQIYKFHKCLSMDCIFATFLTFNDNFGLLSVSIFWLFFSLQASWNTICARTNTVCACVCDISHTWKSDS